MLSALLSRADSSLRPLFINTASPWLVSKTYSSSRKFFLRQLASERPEPFCPPQKLAVKCWGLDFRQPLFNAAGMFKLGDGYECMAAQGAGAYIGGSISLRARPGNQKDGVLHPFAPYPRSHAASNWLGLPNDGAAVFLEKLGRVSRVPGCPIGVSVVPSANLTKSEEVADLVQCMKLCEQGQVDFLEFNVSCPNTATRLDDFQELFTYLRGVAAEFLAKRERVLPVVVKLGHDIREDQLTVVIEEMIKLRYDGVNLTNTSTAYDAYAPAIAPEDRGLYQFFIKTFGGSISGRPLKKRSLELTAAAVQKVREIAPPHEFRVIRTGGVESARDVQESLTAGASLVQWFTGYFESFAEQGHSLYRRICTDLASGQSQQETVRI